MMVLCFWFHVKLLVQLRYVSLIVRYPYATATVAHLQLRHCKQALD